MSKQNGKWLVSGSVELAKLSAAVQAEINDVANKLDSSEVGVSVASLVAGKVPASQLPSAIMEYKGVYNATTNSPTLANGVGNTDDDIGNVYRVTVAGTQDFGAGSISFEVGDYVILNDSKIWEKSDTTDAVASVNGQVGIVVLDTDDISEGTNKYFSDALAQTAVITQVITNGVTNKAPSEDAVFDALAGKADVSHSHAISDVTGLQTALDGKVDENVAIIAGTKTKITYDEKGLVTAGADATTDDISEGATNKYYASSLFDADLATKDLDDIAAGTTNVHFTATEAIKLAGIEAGATADQNASEVPYTPAVSGDWNVAPSQVAAGLDELAQRVEDAEAAIAAITDPVWVNQEFVLSAGDITNQYVTLSNAPIAASVLVHVDGGPIQRVAVDYSITGTQLDFDGDLALLAEAGDVLIVKYQHL
jgi:hypothetical protein